jgi:hypothetical protein
VLYLIQLKNKGGIFMTRTLQTKVESGAPLVATDITDLTFFPVGSILMMDGSWTDGRGGWYICDGRNTPHGKTPNLLDRFICGGTSSGTLGGSNDAQSITLSASNLPSHKHGIKDTTHNHDQSPHNHTQNSHGHNDNGHSHSHSHSTHTGFTAQFTQVGFGNTYGVAAVGNGNVAVNDGGAADEKIQISYTPDAHSTDNTAGKASISSETAVNQQTTAENKAASTGITETESVGSGAPITVSVVPAYYTMIYIKKMA